MLVEYINARRAPIVLHTVKFGQSQNDTLEKLANAGGGEYRKDSNILSLLDSFEHFSDTAEVTFAAFRK